MKIQLSDHFTYKKLIRFVIPSVIMMIFTSLYGVVDGVLVSNFVGKTPFAAINLIWPVIMAAGAIGFMIGAGGSAVISKTLGEGKRETANRYFSMLVYISAVFSAVLAVALFVFMPIIARALGAEGELFYDCVAYGRALAVGIPVFVLQSEFQSFCVTAEKPGMSLKISVASGVVNIVLDLLFIAVFEWGTVGAAAATVIGQLVGAVIPIIYFARKNNSILKLGRAGFDGRILLKTCANGSSEMVANLSASIVNILYNFQLMRIAGENGVAAYGVIMYVNFVFMGVFFGYSMGSAPIVGYHYGAGNHNELKNMFVKSITVMTVSGIVMTAAAEALTPPLVKIFAGYDTGLFEMTCRGFRLYSAAFLIMGVNVWGSSFFTALNNGAVSAVISFLRTLVFQIAAVIALPAFLGIDGVWLAISAAELASLAVTVIFLAKKKKVYNY